MKHAIAIIPSHLAIIPSHNNNGNNIRMSITHTILGWRVGIKDQDSNLDNNSHHNLYLHLNVRQFKIF